MMPSGPGSRTTPGSGRGDLHRPQTTVLPRAASGKLLVVPHVPQLTFTLSSLMSPPDLRASRPRLFLDRIRRDGRDLAALGLEILEDDLDGFVELVVDAGELPGRVVVDDDIGLDADALDDPALALRAVRGELGLVERAAVEERQGAADADDAAPGALADERAELEGLEPVGEDVPVGGRELVAETDLGAEEGRAGVGAGDLVPGHLDHDHLPDEPVDDHRRDVAAAVAADVDDQGFLAQLGIEMLDELVEAVDAHVRDVDVADLAARGLVDLGDVRLHPVVVVKRVLGLDGHDDGVAGALAVGAGRDLERDLLAGRIVEGLVDVGGLVERAAVDRQDVLPFPDIDADLGQG